MKILDSCTWSHWYLAAILEVRVIPNTSESAHFKGCYYRVVFVTLSSASLLINFYKLSHGLSPDYISGRFIIRIYYVGTLLITFFHLFANFFGFNFSTGVDHGAKAGSGVVLLFLLYPSFHFLNTHFFCLCSCLLSVAFVYLFFNLEYPCFY